jgi:hypothetical protein
VASQKRHKIAELGVEEQRHFPAMTIIAIDGFHARSNLTPTGQPLEKKMPENRT